MIPVPTWTQRFPSLLSALPLVLISALMFAGCGEETTTAPPGGPDNPTTGGESSGESGGGTTPQPSLQVAPPSEGLDNINGALTVVAGTDISLSIKTKFVTLVEPVEGAEAVEGERHFGVYIGAPIGKNKVYAGIGVQTDTDGGPQIVQVPIPHTTPQGINQLYVRLLNNDGSYTAGFGSQDVFSILVEEGGEGISLTFLSPADGTQLGAEATLSFVLDVTGLTWVAPGSKTENAVGEGHVAIYLDDAEDPSMTLTEDSGQITLGSELGPGKHTLRASIRQNDDAPYTVKNDDAPATVRNCEESPEHCSTVEDTITFYITSNTEPSVTLNAPTAGSVVHPGDNASINVSVQNFLLVPPGEGLSSAAGQVTIHFDDLPEPIGVGGSAGFEVTIPEEATSGPHQLTARLVQDDGTVTSAEASVTVNVPTVTIEEPVSNALLGKGGEFDVSIELQGFTLVPVDSGTPNALGEGHYQLFLDDEESAFFTGDKITATAIVPESATTGFHNLRLSLRNNDGSAVGVESTVTIAVGEGIPVLKIQTPQPSKTVQAGGTLVVSLSVTNFTLTPKQENAIDLFGEGHYQIHLDATNAENLLAEGATNPAIITLPEGLTPGVHKITASLYSNTGEAMDIDDDVLITAVPLSAAVITALHPAGGTAYAAGSQIHLNVETAGITLVPPVENGTNIGGEGHYQVFIDEAPTPALISADTETILELPEDIGTGSHSLTFAIANNNGTLVSGSTDTVPFTVWEAPAVEITSPDAGNAYAIGDSISLEVAVTGMTLTDSLESPVNAAEEGHYSVYIGDGDEAVAEGSTPTLSIPVTASTPGGIQDLRVSLRNNDDSEILGADATVSIQVDTPTITFLDPNDASCYAEGADLEVNIDVSNFTLIPQSIGLANQDGEGHYFVYLDDADGAEFIYSGADNSFTVALGAEIAPGTHSLRIALVANDNSPLGIEETVSFLVSATGLVITDPVPGKIVQAGGTLDINMVVTNFQFDLDNEFGATNVPGTGHARIYLDDATGDDHLADATNSHVEITLPADLSDGDHWIHVVLTENDGTPLSPAANAKVHITAE